VGHRQDEHVLLVLFERDHIPALSFRASATVKANLLDFFYLLFAETIIQLGETVAAGK
jgi:hypothetical protein